MRRRRNCYLVWLEWPEKCFRVNARQLRYLSEIVPEGSKIIRARSERAFLKALPMATHAIVWSFKQEWFARAPKLRVLATPGAGRELVPTVVPPRVTVRFGHFHGTIMAENVMGFMLAWARGFFRPESTHPEWQRAALSDKCFRVAGTQAVVVGCGHVGRLIIEALSDLGVKSRGFRRESMHLMPQYAKHADWFIMTLPSDTGTDNFLNAEMIRKLPRKCVVINVGRGNAVDEEALLDALRSGRLAGAYLDVFKGEPGPLQQIVRKDSGAGILGTPAEQLPWNLVRTPHSSAFAPDYLDLFLGELDIEDHLYY